MILGSGISSSGGRRWITVLADGVFGQVKGRISGLQLVVGVDYQIWDFTEAVKNGSIQIKSDRVAILVGNNHVERSMKINMGKQIWKLIQQIAMVKQGLVIYVCSLMVRPEDEIMLQPVIMKANNQIHNMCQKATKSGGMDVHYVPMHQEFLEKWRHFDVKSGQMRVTTRISRPHDQWFAGKKCQLNAEGVKRAVDTLWRAVTGEKGTPMRRVTDVADMKIMVLNEEDKQDVEAAKAAPCEASIVRSETDPEASAVGQSDSDEKGVTSEYRKRTRNKNKRSGTEPMVQVGGKVAKLVDQWEENIRLGASDSLDVELGEDSIVRVDLGESGGN